ncbi:unnamed protein product, partial [Oncorhynchus mykiss]
MEKDTTIRRIKSLYGTQSNVSENKNDSQDQCGINGCSEVKKKPEVSLYLLHEGVGVALVTVFILVLWGVVHLSLQQLVIGKSTGEFNAIRARKHLERITSVGPRPTGSPENEILTVNFLLEQIEHIKADSASGPHSVTVDVQRPTGSFSIDFLGGFTSYYDRVSNIAVRLEPKAGAQHLMLANCHFDSSWYNTTQPISLYYILGFIIHHSRDTIYTHTHIHTYTHTHTHTHTQQTPRNTTIGFTHN